MKLRSVEAQAYPDKKSYSPKVSGHEYVTKFIELNIGLFICAIGMYMTVQANVGLAPWMALNVGLENLTGIGYGLWNDIIGIVLIFADFALGEKSGFGTFGDCLLIGSYVQIMDFFGLFPVFHSFWIGIVIMLLGILIQDVACFYIMDSAFGIGPRDSLMVALARRLPKLSVGQVRILIEASALLIGWIMGAKVGLGTVIYMIGVGTVLDLVFALYKFDARRTHNEGFIETIRNIAALRDNR